VALVRRTLLALAAAALVAGPAAASPGGPVADDMSLGSPKAPVEVVEYASAACPHCAHFNETVFPAFKAKYVDTGRVRYTLKEFLTAPANVAAAGFLLARCAGPDKYFKVLDEVFRSQPRWQSGNIKPIFVEIGAANGVSAEQFDACLTDKAAQDALQARIDRNMADGVEVTPTIFVNGKMIPNDKEITLAVLDEAIAEAAKARPRAGGKR
jgi:protein-disulfide isomerase